MVRHEKLSQKYLAHRAPKRKPVYGHFCHCGVGRWLFGGIAFRHSGYALFCGPFFDETHLFDLRIVGTMGLTDEDIQAVQALDDVTLTVPVQMGQIVIEHLCGTQANVVATRDLYEIF